MTAEDRIKEIEEFCRQVKDIQPAFIENHYSGPWNARKVTQVGFAQFHTSDQVRVFLEKLPKKTIEIAGATVSVKKAMPKRFLRRNWYLREAEKLVTSSKHGHN